MSVTPDKLLVVRDLATTFTTTSGPLPAVGGVSFDLNKNETLGIVGESGSGKTVLARTIMGLQPRTNVTVTGSVLLNGHEMVGATENEKRQYWGTEVAMVFQDPMTSLNPVTRIGKQIDETLRVRLGMSKEAAKARAIELLELVGIPSPLQRYDAFPGQLSGGMRQRVMIAMALACEPKLLIADEPTTALDVTIQAQILDLLRKLVAERETALILITHDLGVVAGMCTGIDVMYGGMFMERGTAEHIFKRPRHPYTLGLLESVPRLDYTRRVKLRPITGAPRDMLSFPSACPFQPRCRFEVEQSRQEVPHLVEIESGHYVACFNPVPVDEWQKSRKEAAG